MGSGTSPDPFVVYTGVRMVTDPRAGSGESGSEGGIQVDIITGLIGGVLTIGVIFGVIVLLAGLFMVIFSIAAGIDRRIQE